MLVIRLLKRFETNFSLWLEDNPLVHKCTTPKLGDILFPDGQPRTMQKYASYRIKRDPYFCNLSGTGAGKTLSAILASRVIDSKMTLVICPNDVVDQWATEKRVSITAIFPSSKVTRHY